ncbi:hypothetical protein AAGS39_47430 [Flavobacterium sp. CGRL2]
MLQKVFYKNSERSLKFKNIFLAIICKSVTFDIMDIEKDYIKLIFGLKLKQVRTQKKSFSFWLGQIDESFKIVFKRNKEKGKYPKADKNLAFM